MEVLEPIGLSKDVSLHCSAQLDNSPFPDFLQKVSHLKPKEISYAEFFDNHLKANRPIMFSKEITSEWSSRKDWVTPDGKINFSFLEKMYGNCEASVTKIKDDLSMDSGGMEKMVLRDFLHYWEEFIQNGHPDSETCLYLKDWHIMISSSDSSPKINSPYTTPHYFASDWLNETWEDKNDDFKFTYMGPKGSWTPFHSDVYGSFSWSANIIGKKKWRLYPPGKEKLFQSNSNDLIKYSFSSPGTENIDFIEVIQEAGEIIFVPSGWHHIVWNEEDTISINHNWFNASNICHVWSQLRKALEDVEHELNDLKDMDGFFHQCQLVLKANHGMDYLMLLDLLSKININRSNMLEDKQLEFDQRNYDLRLIHHIVSKHLNQDKSMQRLINLPQFNDLRLKM